MEHLCRIGLEAGITQTLVDGANVRAAVLHETDMKHAGIAYVVLILGVHQAEHQAVVIGQNPHQTDGAISSWSERCL